MTCPKIYCGPVDFNISKSVWLRIRFVKYSLSTAPLKSLTEIAFGPVFDISNWPIPKTLAWLLGGGFTRRQYSPTDVTVHHLPHFHAKSFVYSQHGLVFMLNFKRINVNERPSVFFVKEYWLMSWDDVKFHA